MVLNFVVPIVMKIGEYLVAPAGSQFGYLFFYETNIKNLKKQVQNLDDKRVGTQLLVDAAKRNREIIGLDVDRWLITVDELAEEVKKFLDDEVKANKGCFNGWCPNLKSRYSLSRKANKKIKVVVGLCGEGNFSRVSYPAPPVAISSTSIGGFKGFESRRSIMNEVMEALTDDSVDMIGISGMGGVGKTTLVKEVAKKTEEKKLFDEIVFVLVSQNPSLVKIQGEIAEVLGLKLFGENNLLARAKELSARILTSKRVLVILDDVWDRLELNEIGIPFGDDHKGCKIVLTSRSEDVCNHMGTRKKITVQVLPEEESWNLFKEMAGISNDTSHTTDLHSTQKAVAKECGGLPIAIVTVGRALNGREKPSWDYALSQLQKSIGKNIKGVDGKVFQSLELSYNYLESEEAKKCFLLCSLFPEDSSIPIEDLVRYGIGLELFEGVGTVGEARNRVRAFVDDCKKSYLLMDFERYNVRQECVEKQDDVISICGSEFKISWDELLDSLRSIEVKDERNECVKMHDVIRDVAISIASREEHSHMVRCDEAMEDWPEKDRQRNYTAISLRCTGMHSLPHNLELPNLQLLRLEYHHELPETPDCFYQGMQELKVVALAYMDVQSLPTSLQCLTNLRTLSIYHCKLSGDISVIGALKNLEILSFTGSTIEVLPKEMGNLTHLKLLYLLKCQVNRISPGVLSSLSRLEELYVGDSVHSWNVPSSSRLVLEEGEEELEITTDDADAASIAELASLPNLVVLDIYLPDLKFWPRDLVLGKVKIFYITVGCRPQNWDCYLFQQNQLTLYLLDISELLESGLKMLLKSTKILELTGGGGLNLKNGLCDLVDREGFECLTELSLNDCGDLEFLINSTDHRVPRSAFPVLESLFLYNLDNFKGIICHSCHLPKTALELQYLPEIELTPLWKSSPTQIDWFCRLRSLTVQECEKLECAFSFSMARGLVQLQNLNISGCKMMEAIVSSCQGGENEIAADKIELPKLTELDLYNLLSFTTFCKATNAIELPQLNNLNLWEIPKLKNLCCPTSESNYDTIIPSLFYNKNGGLTQLDWLHNLKSIHVEACNEMESVFSLSMARGLVQLQTLEIRRCDMIEAIILSEGGEHEIAATSTANKIEFPKLDKLYLHQLPSFTAFCEAMNVIELPQLKDLNLSDIPKFNSLCNPTSVSNYDTVIQPLFDKKVKFSSIEKLFFSQMDNLIEIWPGELGAKLREISIYKCHGLLNIFPASSIKFMQDLELLEVKECRSVKVAFDLGELIVREGHPAVALFSLTNVKLIHLPKLSHVWMNNSARIQGFNHLRSLRVKGCGKLRNLFSSSLAKLFVKLQELEITECVVMEAVIAKEQRVDDEVTPSTIIFPQLTSLKLNALPNLMSFCPQGYTFEGSFLKNLRVINCPKMEALPSVFQHIQELQRSNDGFHEDVQKTDKAPRKIILRSKGELTIMEIDDATEIWHSQLVAKCLHEVRLMWVQCCGKLSTVTSSSSMQKFHNLAQLKVWWCDSVDVIFDLKGICAEEGTITQLNELEFKYLPKLMHIWKINSPQQTQCFRNLRSLKVKRCDSVRYIFTLSMAKVLLNLECLRVGHCEKVEKIVMRDEEEEDDEVNMYMRSTVFPKLRSIKLKDLPSFVCFGPGENDRVVFCRN